VQKFSLQSLVIALSSTLAINLAACSPKFDWREVRGTESAFSVWLPAKPASFSREMTLNGVALKMQMTAADVDGISFAVGSAKVADASKIPGVLDAMQLGMLNNIHGVPENESSPASDHSSKDLVAYGRLANGQPVKFVGRFLSRGAWVYQIVIIGKDKSLTPEVVDTFMTSFKTN
jgi:hypothetical protein